MEFQAIIKAFGGLPFFPAMRKLQIEDEVAMNDFTRAFTPCSDFNFISLWGYDTNADFHIAQLNENLVFRLRDYITNDPFYTFIGKKKISDTARAILEQCKEEGITEELKLVAEICIESLGDKDGFLIEEDRDNFDYIYLIENLAEMRGGQMHKMKNFVNRFTALYPQVQARQINPVIEQEKIMALFDEWKANKPDPEHERIALERTLKDADRFKKIGALGLFDHDKLIAFMIYDSVKGEYAQSHFAKALAGEYKGVYPFLYNATALTLEEKGVRYFNLEQDMGIEGLRRTKEQLNPIFFLKKFKIRKN